MFDCKLDEYIAIGMGVAFLLLILYGLMRESTTSQERRDREELYRLRRVYNPDAIKQDQEILRMKELEQRYGLKGHS
jgi:hypothetical protein